MKTTEELKNLLYKNETVADAAPDAIAAAQDFCEGYKTFLDNAKTEREATAYSEKLLTAAGYQKFVPGTSYAPGTKVYTINREKCILAATIGTKSLEEGFHLKRIVSMVRHLHERQAGSPQLKSFAVNSETESAGYSGEERLLPRPARSLYALINGVALAAETFGSERTHP